MPGQHVVFCECVVIVNGQWSMVNLLFSVLNPVVRQMPAYKSQKIETTSEVTNSLPICREGWGEACNCIYLKYEKD